MSQEQISQTNKEVEKFEFKGFDLYKIYLRLHAHFSRDNFNFHTSHTKASKETYAKRNDRRIFEAFARKAGEENKAIQFLVTGFLLHEKNWIGSIADPFFQKAHKERVSRIKNFTATFYKDLLTIAGKCGSLEKSFDTSMCGFPYLLKMAMEKCISLETVIVLDATNPFLEQWKIEYLNNFVVAKKVKLLCKYKPFLGKIRTDRFIAIIERVRSETT